METIVTSGTEIEPLKVDVTQPGWRVPIPWWTGQSIRVAVLMHRNFPLSMAIVGVLAAMTMLPFTIGMGLAASIDRRLMLVALFVAAPMLGAIVVWISQRLSHRTSGRGATPAEVATLRLHVPAWQWSYVQHKAGE